MPGEVRLGADDLLVSVGGLVDRGPSPGEVARLFRERPNSVVVMATTSASTSAQK